jgi:hypothetical protein
VLICSSHWVLGSKLSVMGRFPKNSDQPKCFEAAIRTFFYVYSSALKVKIHGTGPMPRPVPTDHATNPPSWNDELISGGHVVYAVGWSPSCLPMSHSRGATGGGVTSVP